MGSLETFSQANWDGEVDRKGLVVKAIEGGKVGYFPTLAFPLRKEEQGFLDPSILELDSKNVSYDIKTGCVKGASVSDRDREILKGMMHRYAMQAARFLTQVIPHYANRIIQGKTSFRPAEIEGRKTSRLKDDTLLHVDAFPSNPTHGQRILRLFTNVNPHGKPRVWLLGEPFEEVVKRMGPRLSRPIPGVNLLLQLLKITKKRRSPYDHYMLQLHDTMKRDESYQKEVSQEKILFSPGSSWMVYTDQVSHAALAGQHVFEQTFHLAVKDLEDQKKAPLAILENYFHRALC